jgi:uncharacterized membrane protein YeiB
MASERGIFTRFRVNSPAVTIGRDVAKVSCTSQEADMLIERVRQWTGANWFIIIVPVLAGAAYFSSRHTAWSSLDASMEAALLFDACVTIPLLYLLCHRGRLPWWQLAPRMIGLASLGIYLLNWIIPPETQQLFPTLRWRVGSVSWS